MVRELIGEALEANGYKLVNVTDLDNGNLYAYLIENMDGYRRTIKLSESGFNDVHKKHGAHATISILELVDSRFQQPV